MNCKLLLAATAALAATVLLAARPTQDAQDGKPDPMAMFGDAAKYLTPNENHQWLGQFIGEWDATSRIWMMPGQAPMESKGKASVRWLVEGRWIISESDMTMFGMPVKTTAILGYDNFKKKYVSTTVDSFQTCMLNAEGFRDQAGTALHLYGPMDEYLTGENDKTVRYTHRIVSPDKRILEVHDLAIGETNTKVVEFEFTRHK